MSRIYKAISAICRPFRSTSTTKQHALTTVQKSVDIRIVDEQSTTNDETIILPCPKCGTSLALKNLTDLSLASNYSFDIGITLQSGGLDHWTPSRTLTDILQNHIDETRIKKANLWARGKKDKARELQVEVSFVLHNGQTLSRQEAKSRSIPYKQVKSIVISDKGEGYSQEMLRYILSFGKTTEENKKLLGAYEALGIDFPGGQFGEGQKMVAAAILKINKEQEDKLTRLVMGRENIGLVYKSQNWEATLFGNPVVITKGDETINTASVAFNVACKEETIEGSQTIIENPTKDFFYLVRDLDRLVLDFAGPLQKVAKAADGFAFKQDGIQSIYVRGYHINDGDKFTGNCSRSYDIRPPLFSYNLATVKINRDRDQEDIAQALATIGWILYQGATKGTIREIISDVRKHPSVLYTVNKNGEGGQFSGGWTLECEALNGIPCHISPEQKALWLEVFYECFGKDAMLSSSSDFKNESSKKAIDACKNLVVLNYPLFKLFKDLGVKTDLEYEPDFLATYPLGLSLDYEKEKWGVLRIVLNFLQNHADAVRVSKTPITAAIEFQVKGQKNWLPYSKISDFQNQDIVAVCFRDKLKNGYAHTHLSQFGSNKKKKNVVQVGNKGEGLKIASAASLRLGMNVTLRSQRWIANASSYDVHLENEDGNFETSKNLCFVVYRLESSEAGSETIIKRPDDSSQDAAIGNFHFNELLSIMRSLKCYVLRHKELGLADEKPVPIEKTPQGNIVSSECGDIYVKDFFITSEERERLLFGYNFHDLDTNRDRDIVGTNELKNAIGQILSQIRSRRLIGGIIKKAVEDCYGQYHEFQNLTQFQEFDQTKSEWLSVFREMYGKDAVLKSNQASAQAEAEFIGYRVVHANEAIARTLIACGARLDADVISAQYECLSKNNLTQKERDVLEVARFLDENEIVFSNNLPTEYRVFECAVNTVDKRPMPWILACADIENKKFIAFKREILSDPISFLEAYLEEKAHQLSGAPDGTRAHFNKSVEGAVWLIRNLKDNSNQANAKFKEAFPDFDTCNLTLVADSEASEIEFALEDP